MTNRIIEGIRFSDGLNKREIRTLRKLSSREILKKMGNKEKFIKNILDKIYNFDKLKSVSSIYEKAKKNKSFAALLQLYMKLKGTYRGRIDGIFGIRSLKGLKGISSNLETKYYPSILKLEKMKEAIKLGRLRVGKYKVTLKRLNLRKKRGITKVKMKYSGVKYDYVKIDDAIALYKDMMKAGEISIRIDEAGIKNAKHYKYNYEAARRQAKKEYSENKESGPLSRIYAYALTFYKKGYREGEKRTNRLVGFNTKEIQWCGGFIAAILKHEGISLRNVRNTRLASSYFGLDKLGIRSGCHIMISDGHGYFVGGNTNDKVDKVYKGDDYVCWIHPKDIGNPNKIHWRQKGEIPPAGALVLTNVYGKNRKALLKKIYNIRKKMLSSYRYRDKERYSVPHRRDPLKVLSA